MKSKFKKSVLLRSLIACSLALTSCGSSSSTENKDSEASSVEAELSPIDQFNKVDSIALEKKINEDLTSLQMSLQNSFSAMAVFYEPESIEVTSDENFEIVTVSAKAAISRDESYGWNLGLALTLSNPSKVVCAGESQYGLTTFHDYLGYVIPAIRDEFKYLPSKGIVFKLNWVGVDYKTDKYGAQTEVYTDLKDDQVGFTSTTFGKIVDASQINPWKLSDLGTVVKHNSSWDGSLSCKYQQSLLN